MAKGVLGVLACPILEDELVYSMSKDDEISNVYLLDNRHAKSIKIKLARNGIKHTIVGEREFLEGARMMPDDGFTIAIWMMDLGLHEEPADLGAALKKC
ncbi:MAG: hypothetical protein FWC44_05055, partial [Methanomassiliicoccaceae archaeon]|nr:hypothetical protein [Methanomassiliicoccaceae archaeon]